MLLQFYFLFEYYQKSWLLLAFKGFDGSSWNYLVLNISLSQKRPHMISSVGPFLSGMSLLSGSSGSLAIGGCPFLLAIY